MDDNRAVAQPVEHRLDGPDGGYCVLVEVVPAPGAPAQAPDGATASPSEPQAQHARAEVLMLPGMFTGRGFWRSEKGIGLATHLAEAGLRCWLLERRGMGAAANQKRGRRGMQEAATQDLPAAWQHIRARSSAPIFVVGHSFGGVLAIRALSDSLPAEDCAGLVTLATQCEVGKSPLRPPGAWLTTALVWALGRLPARLAGLGPSDEPRDAVRDAVAWTTEAQRGRGWVHALQPLPMPQLAITSAGDHVDPAEGCERLARRIAGADFRFVALGKADGWAEDYSHPGMVVSRNARTEVWPLIRDWILERA